MCPGFHLDVDYGPSPDFRVVQLTPPGSACSVQIGVGLTDAEPGSVRGLYLVVPDLEGARAELAERGVDVGEIRHKAPLDAWQGGFEPGVDPERRDYSQQSLRAAPASLGTIRGREVVSTRPDRPVERSDPSTNHPGALSTR